MRIYHLGTYYGLLISLLLPETNIDKSFFFLTSDLDVDIDEKQVFFMKIKKLRFPFTVFYYDFYLRNKLHSIVKEKELDTSLVIGQDHIIGKDYFLKYNYHLIEDGMGIYTTFYIEREKYKKRYIYNKILNKKNWNGVEETVTKIYLTKKDNIPIEIKDKVEIINLKKLWNSKTKEEQKKILKIFKFNFEEVEKLSDRKYILFTQPLSEDLVITEDEKIEIYKKVMKNYDEEKMIIKTHPRELTDYKKIFSKAILLNNQFPAELLSILDIKFKKVITLFSTSVKIFENNIEIDFYGTEVNPKVLVRFGNQDKVIKRNAFIKEEKNE